MKQRFFLIIPLLLTAGLFWFSACAPTLPVIPGTGIPAAENQPSAYDGHWQGSGRLPGGKIIDLTFDIQNARVSSVTYGFIGPNGLPCTNLNYTHFPAASQSVIEGDHFTVAGGIDLQLSAVFASPNESSGTLTVDWQGRSSCITKFEISWHAVKKILAAAPVIPPQPAHNACGSQSCAEVMLQLLLFGLSNGAVLALNAVSVSVMYGAVRTLNLAHGDLFSLTTVLVTSIVLGLKVKAAWPSLLIAGVLVFCLTAAVIFGMLLNIGLEYAAFRPFRGRSRLAPVIASLGISFILFQAAMIWRTHQGSWIWGEHRSVPGLPEVPTDGIPSLLPGFDLVKALGLSFHITYGFNDLLILLLSTACAAGTLVFLRHTRTGLSIRACMENPSLAQMIGINLNGTIRKAFAISGMLAGAAAFVFAVYYGRPFGQNGAQSGLFAFTAALLGGIGNPIGALISAMLLGIFSSFSDYFFSAEWTPVLVLLFLIFLLYLRPHGIFDEGQQEQGSDAAIRDSVTAFKVPLPGKINLTILILAALAIFPLFSVFSGLGWQIMVRGIGIFIILALGLNILLGFAGVLDLGYAAAFGIGAYAAAILTNPWGLFIRFFPVPPDFILVLIFSAFAAGLFGWIKELLTSRLQSDFLTLATLAIGLMIPRLVVNLKGLTGAAAGISALPAPRIFGWSFASPAAGYLLVYLILVLVSLLSLRLSRSRTGRAWLSSADDETASAASGINTGRYRLLAMIISSSLAGIAGALYAGTFAYVDPDILSFHWTAMLLTMVVLGGAGDMAGVMLGAILVIGYDKIFIPRFSELLSLFWPKNYFIGSVPDLRGTSFLNFGLILYLTILLRTRLRRKD